MSDDVVQFYQQLAQDYHLIYADWNKAIERQSNALDRLIRTRTGGPPLDLLDCSCGIGTQAIGLAARGYHVHATDISPAAVERAGREAAAHGVTLTVGVADLRRLPEVVEGTFDIVLSCDNALPHLITDEDLLLGARSMRAKVRPSGLLVASISDNDRRILNRLHATTPQVFDDPEGRRIVFQVWDWGEDDRVYTVSMFILREIEGTWRTARYVTTYRAVLRAELSAILQQAGFTDIRWHMPQDTGYFQPIVTARPA